MSEERRRILQLLADGKIAVADAERLLQALGEPAPGDEPAAPTGGEKPKPRFLLINVKKKGASNGAEDEERRAWGWPGFTRSGRDKDVSLRVPLAIVRNGMRLGAIIPGLDGTTARLRERGIAVDLTKLDPQAIESMLEEMGEMNIDIDSGRAQVRITCE